MSASPPSIRDDHPPGTSDTQALVALPKTNSDARHQRVEQPFHYTSSKNGKATPRHSQTSLIGKENIARKLQRIDMLLNLVYARVANDRSLEALLPYIPEHEARNLVSNFGYVRHQQDTQELKSGMTDKQTYRIFRHHYRAEQRLADMLRELRHSAAKPDLEEHPAETAESKSVEVALPLTHAVVDLENDTAKMRVHHLEQVQSELKDTSYMYQSDDDLLYVQEFSQEQQINTMQARCTAMKDEYEADDMRKGRVSFLVSDTTKLLQETISGPEDWEDESPQPRAPESSAVGFGVLNGEWTPPDPPRLPSLMQQTPHKLATTDAHYVESGNTVHGPRKAHAEDNLSIASTKEDRKRRSRRQSNYDQPERRHERREQETFRNPDTREKKVHTSGLPERRSRRGVATQKASMFANPKIKNSSHREDLHSRQHRHSRYHPPLPDQDQGRRHRVDSHTAQFNSQHYGRPQRTSRARITPRNSSQAGNHPSAGQAGYYYSNTEFATMPNLRRKSLGYHKETSYDDAFAPLQGSSGGSQYVGGDSLDPFRKPFPHESADAFGWKPPEGTGVQYYSGSAAPEQPATTFPGPGDPYLHANLAATNYHQDGGYTPYAGDDQVRVPAKTRKRDDWRYSNALSSGLLDGKDSLFVMQSLANKVKGRKAKPTVPHNPIEAMQLARKDPVKFMTTMVAGEVLPQSKRKAHKFESMLGNASKAGGVSGQVGHMLKKVTKESMTHGNPSKTGASGQVGHMLTKVAKESLTHGGPSKTGVSGQVGHVLSKVAKESLTHGGPSKTGASGQVGQMLAKMTLDSALGKSSKANVTSQVGNALAKVAKDSVKQTGSSSHGGKMIKQVMNSLAKA